jgi:hypothetical protein
LVRSGDYIHDNITKSTDISRKYKSSSVIAKLQQYKLHSVKSW